MGFKDFSENLDISARPGSADGDALASAIAKHGLIVLAPLASDPAPSQFREAYVATVRCMGLRINDAHEPQVRSEVNNSQ